MTNRPPDLEEIIRRGQEKAIGANGGVYEKRGISLTTGQGIQAMLAFSLLAFTIVLGGSVAYIGSKLDKAEALIERGVTVMDKLPAATDRMEKLLDRVDTSVQRGVSGLKEAAPAVTEGWINGIRNGLNKESK